MTRGMAILVTLLVLLFALFTAWLSQTRTLYFPVSLQNTMVACAAEGGEPIPIIDEFEASWYSSELWPFEEPSLINRGANERAIRFTWLRSFHDPVVVRVELNAGGDARLIAKQRGGNPEFDPAAQTRSVDRAMTRGEIDLVINASSALPDRSSHDCVRMVDGARWVIETHDPESGYRVHIGNSPEDGVVRDAGLTLIGLTGWSYADVY